MSFLERRDVAEGEGGLQGPVLHKLKQRIGDLECRLGVGRGERREETVPGMVGWLLIWGLKSLLREAAPYWWRLQGRTWQKVSCMSEQRFG